MLFHYKLITLQSSPFNSYYILAAKKSTKSTFNSDSVLHTLKVRVGYYTRNSSRIHAYISSLTKNIIHQKSVLSRFFKENSQKINIIEQKKEEVLVKPNKITIKEKIFLSTLQI